tara:strand:- start:77 stop:400 length:324 start_codon:yes stop_codon:yes gene_type:complete
MEPKEIQGPKATRVIPVLLVQPEPKVTKETRVKLEFKVRSDLLEQLVLMGLKEMPVLKATKVIRVKKETQEPKVTKARKVTKEILVPKGFKVYKEKLELQVSKEFRV